jgi:hypothetical protein
VSDQDTGHVQEHEKQREIRKGLVKFIRVRSREQPDGYESIAFPARLAL